MKALIIIDIQNDFCPGGSLPVNDGDQVVPVINELQPLFPLVLATQDWHPADHGSFAPNHPGKKPGDIIELQGIEQILWPTHCVQESKGAEFHQALQTTRIKKIFRKGSEKNIDSYSTFFDNGHLRNTGLGDYLKENGVTDVYLAGLATDYCVKYSALDAREFGFNTWVIIDGCRGVNLQEGDSKKAVKEMEAAGVNIILSAELFLDQ